MPYIAITFLMKKVKSFNIFKIELGKIYVWIIPMINIFFLSILITFAPTSDNALQNLMTNCSRST